MSETLYPYGYGTGRYTMAELRNRYEARMHPGYARRLFAWLESRGGAIGIGGGWRTTPSGTSPASQAGKSFHQDQRFASGFVGYCAVDLVAYVGGGAVHRSPAWDEVPEQGTDHPDIAAFGVHCNVGGEPWHLQPIEIDGWQSWDNAGRPDPDPQFPLPGNVTPPPPPGGGGGGRPDLEAGDYGLYPLDPNKPRLYRGDYREHVGYAQAVMRRQGLTLEIDDRFGEVTERCVRELQGWNEPYGVEVDGIIGPVTWGLIDTYATAGE